MNPPEVFHDCFFRSEYFQRPPHEKECRVLPAPVADKPTIGIRYMLREIFQSRETA
jgi:hypothetical protein